MTKKSYTVTEKAGAWVAGKRSPGNGETMVLTEEEARYALISGELEAPEASVAAKKTDVKPAKSEKAAKPETGA